MAIEWKDIGYSYESACVGRFELKVGYESKGRYVATSLGFCLRDAYPSRDKARAAAVRFAREVLTDALAALPPTPAKREDSDG